MPELFICHAPADRALAETIVAYLEPADGISLVREECAQAALPDAWEAAEDAIGAILLLSQDSIPAVSTREVWGRLLESVSQKRGPSVLSVVVQRCNYPKILENHTRLIEWPSPDTDPKDALRTLSRWLFDLTAETESATPALPRLPGFEGRRDELERLFSALVDQPGRISLAGRAGAGKTALAHEFARRARPWFRDVIWIPAGLRPDMQVLNDLRPALDARRVLVVLDNLGPGIELPPTTRESLLITTRNRGPGTLDLVRVASPTLRLPDGDAARLWHAMAACHPERILLPLAARIAGFDQMADARRIASTLAARGLIHAFDESGDAFWMPLASRAAAETESLRLAHAAALAELMRKLPVQDRLAYRAEITASLEWALDNDWSHAPSIAWPAAAALRKTHPDEAIQVMVALRAAAHVRGEDRWVHDCDEELSWLTNAPLSRMAVAEPEQASLW